MLIQIFTTVCPAVYETGERIAAGFSLCQNWYLDFAHTGTATGFLETANRELAEITNIGTAMKLLITDDARFDFDAYLGKKCRYKNLVWMENRSGIKRFAIVYTGNEFVWDSINASIRTPELSAHYNRVYKLQLSNAVKTVVGTISDVLTKSNISYLEEKYK